MKWPATLAAALLAVFLLTPNSTQSSSQPKGMTLAEWLVLVKAYSLAYDVDPNLSLALAHIEGNDRHGNLQFGLHGKYYLPFGIHKDCKVQRPDTPGGNAEAGIRALSRHLHRCGGDLRAALHRYNTGDKGAKFDGYYRAIVALAARHEAEGVFD